jgi:hypothetical protein
MTQTHDDRVADRPNHLCAAYGCPLHGAMSQSTQGTSEWYCFAHFGKDFGSLQRITAEQRRLDWLANAIRDVRDRDVNPNYGAAFQRIEHDLKLAQRKDLLWTAPESDMQWMVRLEREMEQLLNTSGAPAPKQKPLIDVPAQTGTFARVGFALPA